MSLHINLAPINTAPTSTTETRAERVKVFLKGLSQAHPFQAATSLLEALKTLNRQKLDAATRISTLELYRRLTKELTEELESLYGSATTPLTEVPRHYAALAEALWLETGYGYKRALVDLKQKLINIKTHKQHTLVILRAIEALKNEAQVNYLTYTTPSELLWEDLHKLYFHALQLSLENIEITEQTSPYNKTISAVYSQALLMHLANPQRLDKPSISKLVHYIAGMAKHAQLRAIGYIDNPAGIFLIELDSKKPPLPYLKNKNKPNVETDVLFLTLDVARQIHLQLKYIQEATDHKIPLPATGLEVDDEELLTHLIKYLGVPSSRQYSRLKQKQSVKLSIGFDAACILFKAKHKIQEVLGSAWEVINISAEGYAIKTEDLVHTAINIGDIVTIQEKANSKPMLGYVIWLNSKIDHIQAGIRLLSPTTKFVTIKTHDSDELENALLLPKIDAVKLPTSIIVKKGSLKANSIINVTKMSDKTGQLQIKSMIERSPSFNRFEYSLIDDDLS
jgi:cyclic-di-GMP-binding protein